jgi:hypothetical protein
MSDRDGHFHHQGVAVFSFNKDVMGIVLWDVRELREPMKPMDRQGYCRERWDAVDRATRLHIMREYPSGPCDAVSRRSREGIPLAGRSIYRRAAPRVPITLTTTANAPSGYCRPKSPLRAISAMSVKIWSPAVVISIPCPILSRMMALS